MTALTPGCGSNSEARKRAAEATDQHAGCVPGTCRAGDQWRSIGCGDPVSALAEQVDAAAEALEKWNGEDGSLVVASVTRHLRGARLMAMHSIGAAERRPAVTLTESEDDALMAALHRQVYGLADDDELRAVVCRLLAARSQRPEGVTAVEVVARVEALADEMEAWEWGAPVGPGNASYANGYENGRRSVARDLRTALTAEVSGDTEAWECGPHTNAWGGHDARCRRVAGDTEAGGGA